MKIVKMLCPKNKYSIKCPYEMTPEYITVHNTANKASAKSEISYMIGNNNKVSYHCAVDDKEIVQGIEFNRNTWNAGDGTKGKGNRKSIAIEICYSTGDLEKFKNAEKLAAKYIGYLLKERNWGIDKVKKHQDWSGKYCPHKTLDLGWERFLNMIKAELGDTKPKEKPVLEWQKVMNKCYKCGLAEDNSYGPDSKAKAKKYYLHYKTPTIKNDHVKFIQNRLKKLGYKIDVDGSFGPASQKVVKQFQKDKGLEQDGFVGADTTKKLLGL